MLQGGCGVLIMFLFLNKKRASVAQLDACLTGDYEIASSIPSPPGRQHSFVETDHEFFHGD